MRLVGVAASALVLVVGACSSGPFDDMSEVRLPSLGRPAAPAAADVETASARPTQALSQAETADPALLNPDRLIGMDEMSTRAELGEPDAVESAAQATLWRYRSRPGCDLVLFFYTDMSSKTRHVLAYENRRARNAPESVSCPGGATASR